MDEAMSKSVPEVVAFFSETCEGGKVFEAVFTPANFPAKISANAAKTPEVYIFVRNGLR